MKLVELLARELDVWPEQAECATQEGGGCAYFWKSYRLSYVRGDWVHGSGYGLISEDWSHSLSELAVDHTTAIITRADWQAERERIAGGWIAWGGGECPVAKGVDVDYMMRGGVENTDADGVTSDRLRWDHRGTAGDIIAYRLHKPEQASVEAIEAGIAAADADQVKPIAEAKARYDQQPRQEQEEMTPCERLGYKVGDLFVMTDSSCFQLGDEIRLIRDDESDCPKFEAVNGGTQRYESLSFVRKITDDRETFAPSTGYIVTDDPRTMRDRILEIDRTTEALEEERGQLVQRLEDEGFVLARVDGKVEHGEPEEWLVGDLLEITGEEEGHEFEIGQIVVITRIDKDDEVMPYYCKPAVGDGEPWFVNSNEAKFHYRPAA